MVQRQANEIWHNESKKQFKMVGLGHFPAHNYKFIPEYLGFYMCQPSDLVKPFSIKAYTKDLDRCPTKYN